MTRTGTNRAEKEQEKTEHRDQNKTHKLAPTDVVGKNNMPEGRGHPKLFQKAQTRSLLRRKRNKMSPKEPDSARAKVCRGTTEQISNDTNKGGNKVGRRPPNNTKRNINDPGQHSQNREQPKIKKAAKNNTRKM